jgi:uncharacterized coiled-coil DUF342 family protein
MDFEFTSDPEYRKKYSHFYKAIETLLKDPKSAINTNSITKQAGYSRSSIRKDRDQWKPLLIDIEIANKFQLEKPHFVAKATIKKSKTINANAKEYKEKYLNILSAFYDLSRIVDEQHSTISHLENEIQGKSHTITELTQEIESIKSDGKVIPITKKINYK